MFDRIKENKKVILERLTEIIIMVISVSLIILVADNSETFNRSEKEAEDDGLTLWYNDQRYDEYFTNLAADYEKVKGIKVNVKYMSDIDYLENINKANKQTDDTLGKAPDIYLLDSDELEAAYGYGLAKENESSYYNLENYSPTAINAITYKGKKVAYPLTFDTEFMIYNDEYFKSVPVNFQAIINYSKNFKFSENKDVKYIMYWNVEDIYHNYGFVGKYMNIGGGAGDDKTKIDVNTDEVKKAFSFYTELSKDFGINISDDFGGLAKAFMNGEIIASIVTMDEYNELKDLDNPKKISYNVCGLPDLNDESGTKPLSRTETLVVNYMSDKDKEAEELAKYATYDRTDLIYSQTGLFSTKHTDYANADYAVIQEQYDNSCILPKMLVTGDYFAQVQSVLNKAWNGENVEDKLNAMYETYKTRLQ